MKASRPLSAKTPMRLEVAQKILLSRPGLAVSGVELTTRDDRAADRRKPDERLAAAVIVDGEQNELGLPEAERPTDPAGARRPRRVVASEDAHERVRGQFVRDGCGRPCPGRMTVSPARPRMRVLMPLMCSAKEISLGSECPATVCR